METQLVCIIIYLLGQHPGFSTLNSTTAVQYEVCMCVFVYLKRKEREESDKRGSACKHGGGITCWEGTEGLMVGFFKEGDERETGEAFLRLN